MMVEIIDMIDYLPGSSDGIDLVDEDDAGTPLVGNIEQFSNCVFDSITE